jgi:hypothetical protein
MLGKTYRIASFLICLSMTSVSLALTGDGSQTTPWIIANRADFDAYCADPGFWGGCVRLDADITLTGTTYERAPIAPDTFDGNHSFNGTPFTGRFDGNGHKITGLTIDSGGKEYVALIGKIGYGGVVEKLAIENCSIRGDSDFNGALCSYNSGTIRYCYSTGRISTLDQTGGLCGGSTGTIENSFSLVDCLGGSNTGGLCGWMMAGTITHCYAAGEIGYVGDDGGLLGYYSNGTITNGFWDIKMSRCETSWGGTGKTNDQMRTKATFTDGGWDFVGESVNGTADIWTMSHASGNTNGYPMLWWQTDNADASLSGSGTSTSPFIINGRANFDAFCNNTNYWDDCIRLDVDLNLSGTTYTRAPIAFDTAIGPDAYDHTEAFEGIPFAGSFDGNHHTIAGLTIVGGDNCHLGLFGGIRLGEVKNLNLSGCNVSGNLRNIGGLCGAKRVGVISNCSVTGTITGGAAQSKNIGGLCGHLRSNGGIVDCTANVTVSGKSSVGCLVGEHYLDGPGAIVNCSSSGTAAGKSQAGGLCGTNFANIIDCYSEATVTGENSLGGFCGYTAGGGPYNLTVSGCYATGNVTGTGENIAGFCGVNQGIIRDCFARGNVAGGVKQVAGFAGNIWNGQILNSYSTGLVTASPGTTSVAGFCGLCSLAEGFTGNIADCFWNTQTSGMTLGYMTLSSGVYVGHPSETGICVGITSTQMRQQTTFTAAGWDFVGEAVNGTDDIWKMPEYGTNDNFPILAWMSEIPFDGSGTSADPYIIDSRAKFDFYAANSVYWSAYVRLDCHLDLSDTTYSTAPIAPDINDASAGFQGTKFTGNFNGNRHRITGLRILGGSNDYLGLFGYLETGSKVRNLDIRKVELLGYDYIGGLCGYNKGTVEYCSVVSGWVDGGSFTGALVGANSGTIQRCASGCTVTGGDYTGGMTGINDYRATISNSYSTGGCATRDVYAGGFVGLNDGSIVNSYTTGKLRASEGPWGAFCGFTNGSGTVTGCYYNRANGTDSFATEITTSQFIVRSTFVGWDFTGSSKDGVLDIWDMPFYTNQSRPILSWQIDLMDVIENWLDSDPLCDLNDDGIVNLIDLAIHASEW